MDGDLSRTVSRVGWQRDVVEVDGATAERLQRLIDGFQRNPDFQHRAVRLELGAPSSHADWTRGVIRLAVDDLQPAKLLGVLAHEYAHLIDPLESRQRKRTSAVVSAMIAYAAAYLVAWLTGVLPPAALALLLISGELTLLEVGLTLSRRGEVRADL